MPSPYVCSLARLARWIRHDETLGEREKINAIMNQIREKYPEQTKAADEYVNSLTLGYLIQEVRPFAFPPLPRAFPPTNYNFMILV